MPVNGYSIGKDLVLDIVGQNGPIRFNNLINFDSKPKQKDQEIVRLDGIHDHLVFEAGWGGTFEFERIDSAIDDYFAQNEANYYAGISNAQITITETITEVNGSVTQYRYDRVVLKLDDRGSWKGDASVHMRVSFMASRRRKI